jgi:hypothetical protein
MAIRLLRPIRIEGNVAYVPLTQGYEAIIDASDVELVNCWNWFVYKKRSASTAYAYRNGLRAVRPDGSRENVTIPMHRVIMAAPVGMEVDHIDRNGLNNRRDNLRLVTKSQNQHNRAISSNNTSGYKGVFKHKASGKWLSEINVAGKQLYLGLFDTPEDAYAAYCSASVQFHGDYGRVK